jgi:hypothetical protein
MRSHTDLRVGNEEPLLRGEAIDRMPATLSGEHFHQCVVGESHATVVRDVFSEREISVQLAFGNDG